MKSTSLRSRFVRIAARSFGFSSTGPEVGAQVHAEFVGDDVRQRRLAEARRAEQQHMVERFAAHFRRADEDFELLARLHLADVFRQPLRAQRALDRLFVGRRRRCAEDAPCGFEVVGLDRHAGLSTAGTTHPVVAGMRGRHCSG